MITAIENLKKGDFFRLPKGRKVYLALGYERSLKKYEGQNYEDISDFKYFKKGTKVEIGFTY